MWSLLLVKEHTAQFEFYSLAFDESTDMTNTIHLAVFVRGINNEFHIKKELVSLVAVKGENNWGRCPARARISDSNNPIICTFSNIVYKSTYWGHYLCCFCWAAVRTIKNSICRYVHQQTGFCIICNSVHSKHGQCCHSPADGTDWFGMQHWLEDQVYWSCDSFTNNMFQPTSSPD